MRFCLIARGSLEEVRSHLTLARELAFIPEELYRSLGTDIDEIRRMLNGYIAYLKRSKRGADEPGATIREEPAPYSEQNLLEPD